MRQVVELDLALKHIEEIELFVLEQTVLLGAQQRNGHPTQRDKTLLKLLEEVLDANRAHLELVIRQSLQNADGFVH